ncbi:MAG: hypothetical protein WA131_09055 [Desulfitobacteriaceae bacterium]
MWKLDKIMVTFVVSSLVLGLAGCGQTKPVEQPVVEQQKQVVKSSDQVKQQQTVPQYEIIKTITQKRYDGGKTFYVLTNQLDLSNDSFENVIKAITTDLVNKNDAKISIEFHDKKESLDISFKQYGDLSLGRQRTEEENNLVALHYIATFQGEMKNGKYFNTLSFFPLATDNKTVEKYVGSIEFNPSE